MENLKLMGARIRELREIFEYSVEDLAKEVGITPEQFCQYEENGEDIPISILYHLSQKFGIDLKELLTGQEARISTLSVVRKGEGVIINRHPGYHFTSVAHTYKQKIMEPLIVTVMPSEEDPELITHSGQEFNIVLEGSIELIFASKRVILNEGDAVYFNPTYPHGQRAIGGKAVFLTVIAEKNEA